MCWETEYKKVPVAFGIFKLRIGFLCENEKISAVVQRRCVRANIDLKAGAKLKRADLSVLRPAIHNAVLPNEIGQIIGKVIKHDVGIGKEIMWSDIE